MFGFRKRIREAERNRTRLEREVDRRWRVIDEKVKRLDRGASRAERAAALVLAERERIVRLGH